MINKSKCIFFCVEKYSSSRFLFLYVGFNFSFLTLRIACRNNKRECIHFTNFFSYNILYQNINECKLLESFEAQL